MSIDIDENNIKQGVLGLVLALIEIISEILKHQAVRRMDSGSLSGEEIERLGSALRKIDDVINEIKEDNGIKETVRSVKDGIDEVLNDIISGIPRTQTGGDHDDGFGFHSR